MPDFDLIDFLETERDNRLGACKQYVAETEAALAAAQAMVRLIERMKAALAQVDPAVSSILGEIQGGKGATDWYIVNKCLCDAKDALREAGR